MAALKIRCLRSCPCVFVNNGLVIAIKLVTIHFHGFWVPRSGMTTHEGNPVLRLLTIAPSGGVLHGTTTCGAEVLIMDRSLLDSLDEDACYTKRVELFHPDGLACPRCGGRQHLGIHRGHRAPLVDFQCGDCGRVFNAFTGTSLQGTHRRPSPLLMILRGVAQGPPTAQMARALGCARKELLALRHRLQERARLHLDRNPLDDDVVEADEMYQNAGEKRDAA